MKINTFLRLAAAASAPLLLTWLFAASDPVSASPNLLETTSLPAPHNDIIGVPQIILSSYSGYVGDLIKVTGSGFSPGQVITFSVDGSAILSYITGWDSRIQVITDPKGGFGPAGTFSPAQCNFPNVPGGVHVITAQDESGHAARADITILPRITISQLTGPAGTQFKASGSGLRANAAIVISFDDKSDSLNNTNSDALGSFIKACTVPALPDGNHDIHISDGATAVDFSFLVTGKVSSPTLLAPEIDYVSPGPLRFSWAPVSAQSGITYELQVSADPGFGFAYGKLDGQPILLDKDHLGTSEYAMTQTETVNLLKSASVFYWRVRAMDAIGVRGDWSGVRTFSITSAPSSTASAQPDSSSIQSSVLHSTQPSNINPATSDNNSVSSSLKTFGVIGLVIVLLAAVIFFLRRNKK